MEIHRKKKQHSLQSCSFKISILLYLTQSQRLPHGKLRKHILNRYTLHLKIDVPEYIFIVVASKSSKVSHLFFFLKYQRRESVHFHEIISFLMNRPCHCELSRASSLPLLGLVMGGSTSYCCLVFFLAPQVKFSLFPDLTHGELKAAWTFFQSWYFFVTSRRYHR